MKTLNFLLALLIGSSLFAQDRYFTKNGHIDFYSKSPLEDITANNDQVAAFLETATGKLTFGVLIKSFEFEKALMQEHFNENYLESDEYPKSKFSGTIEDFQKIDISKDGNHKVKVTGNLTIHGVTHEVAAEGELKVKSGEINAISSLIVKPEDYQIKIPKAVRDNIAREIKVSIDVLLKPYKK